MDAFILIMLIAAAVCFALAAFDVQARVKLLPLGLLFWVLTVLVPTFDRLVS